MSATGQRHDIIGRRQFLASLPRSVKVGFFFSSLLFVLFERECIQGLWSRPWLHVQLSHPWAYPLFILAPWAFGLWGLWHLSKLSLRDKIEINLVRKMGECLVGIVVFSYLLAWQWSEFILAISKLK
jgi:hypothetical protein